MTRTIIQSFLRLSIFVAFAISLEGKAEAGGDGVQRSNQWRNNMFSVAFGNMPTPSHPSANSPGGYKSSVRVRRDAEKGK